MQRWGKTRAGKQRYFCPQCQKSGLRLRRDNRSRTDFKLFAAWLTSSTRLSEVAKRMKCSPRNLLMRFKSFWRYLPKPKPIESEHEVLIVDGVSVVKHLVVVLVAHDHQEKEPVSWAFVERETFDNWLAFFGQIATQQVKPEFIVCDGQKGLLKAIHALWPGVLIQRCIIHIVRQARLWLTQHPKTEAGQELLSIVKNLLSVVTPEDRQCWLSSFQNWVEQYNEFLKERTYHSVDQKCWWYTHKKLRAVRSLLKNSLDNLFRYIDYPQVPRTSNHVEGGINSRLKDLLRIHRGLKPYHQQILAAWFLAKKQGQKPTQNFH